MVFAAPFLTTNQGARDGTAQEREEPVLAMTDAFTINPTLVLAMLDEIGRNRALVDHETDLIEDIVTMGVIPFRWNPRLDRALLLAATSHGGIARFARRHLITRASADCRLTRLRLRRKKRKTDTAQAKG